MCTQGSLLFRYVLFAALQLLLSLPAMARQYYDEREIQDPLSRLMPSFHPTLLKPVKSCIYILDKDTQSVTFLDRSGNETAYLSYEQNKPFYKGLNQIAGGLKTGAFFYVKDKLRTTSQFRYDRQNNLVEWKDVHTVYDSRTKTSSEAEGCHWIITYNKDNRPLKRYAVDAAGKKTLYDEFFFDAAGRLTGSNQQQWEFRYRYEGNLLACKTKKLKTDTAVYYTALYRYNGQGQLIRFADNYNTHEYEYNAGQLQRMRTWKKDGKTQQEVRLAYSDSLLSEALITTGDIALIDVNPPFIFLSGYLYSWNIGQVNTMAMVFLYDSHRNVREIRYSLNGVYKYSKRFLYTYY